MEDPIMHKILDVVTTLHVDVTEMKQDIRELKDDVTESRQMHERHELLLGEIAKTLLEQTARNRLIKPI
jgi:hypothetical protein